VRDYSNSDVLKYAYIDDEFATSRWKIAANVIYDYGNVCYGFIKLELYAMYMTTDLGMDNILDDTQMCKYHMFVSWEIFFKVFNSRT